MSELDWSMLVGLGGVPVIVALVALVRGWGLPVEYAPGVAVIMGLLWNVGLAPLVPGGVYPLALQGVLAGLAAAGLYDNGQAVLRLVGPHPSPLRPDGEGRGSVQRE